MKIFFAILFVLLAGASLAKDGTVVASDGALLLSVHRHTIVPIKKGNAAQDGPRLSVGFDVFLTNIGKEEITVPTYQGEEYAKIRSREPRQVTIDYWFMLLKDESGVVHVWSPVMFRFVTLRPGERTSLPPFGVDTDNEATLPSYVFRFRVDPEFAIRYQCWTGNLSVTSETAKTPNSDPSAAP